MSPAELALASLCSTAFLGSGAVVAITVKRLFFADWRGSVAAVTVALVGICWALALGQLLGAVGWLRTAPLLGAAVASAAVALLARPWARSQEPIVAPTADDPGPRALGQRALFVASVLLVLLLAAVWTTRTVLTVRRGIYDPDSVGYHLPFAATFAQTGYADPTVFPYPASPIQFFPANDELLASIALVLTRSVAFAAVKNLLYGALVLLAAHAIGKAFKATCLAVSGTAIVLGLPAVGFAEAGEAMNDMLPLFALFGGLAVLAHARDRPPPYVLVGACVGVAYGSKYSTIVPAIALGAFAAWILRTRDSTHRARTAALGAVASLAVGGSWYLRNAIKYGNPLPPARIAIGPFHLRHIATEGAADSFSIAHYLVRGDAFRQFWDGLSLGLSPLFPPVVAAVLFGAVAGLWSTGFRRGLSIVAAFSGISFVTLPGSAYGTEGMPGPGFVINLHYAMPALAMCMVAAAIGMGHRRWSWIVPVVGWFVVVTGIRPGQRVRFWAPEIGGRAFGLVIAAALAGAVVAWMWTRPSLERWVRPAAGATVLLAIVSLIFVARQYPRRSETDAAQIWAARVSPTTIGGWVPAATLYGPGARNRVVTLTRERSLDGGPVAHDSCPQWMQALKEGRFPYAAVISGTKWQQWIEADPAFQLEVENGPPALYRVAVYRVVGEPGAGCARIG